MRKRWTKGGEVVSKYLLYAKIGRIVHRLMVKKEGLLLERNSKPHTTSATLELSPRIIFKMESPSVVCWPGEKVVRSTCSLSSAQERWTAASTRVAARGGRICLTMKVSILPAWDSNHIRCFSMYHRERKLTSSSADHFV